MFSFFVSVSLSEEELPVFAGSTLLVSEEFSSAAGTLICVFAGAFLFAETCAVFVSSVLTEFLSVFGFVFTLNPTANTAARTKHEKSFSSRN